MKFYYIVLVLYLMNCTSNKNDIEVPFKQLEPFINDVNVSSVNIDDIPITEINIDAKNILFYLDEEVDSLTTLGSVIKVTNGFVFYDLGTKRLYNYSTEGKEAKPFANEGRGPGEVNNVRHIDENSEYIYVSDSGNRRINIYDQQLNFFRTETEIYSNEFYVNDSFFVSENSLYNGARDLIIVKEIDDFNINKATLMPRLVPLGYQPRSLNGTHFSFNDNNVLVTAYSAIPWIFIFDDQFEPKQTIVFSKSSFDTLNTWQLKIEKEVMGKSYFGRNPITNIKVVNNGDIFIGLRNELLVLSKNKSDMYEPVKRLVFNPTSESIDQKYFGIYNKVIGSDGERIFIHNYNYLFWINF